MPSFSYTAKSRAGERVSGHVDAHDKRAALAQIERLGYVPIAVKEGGAAMPAPAKGQKKTKPRVRRRASSKQRMALRDLLFFTRELSDLLASGMTLGTALGTLSNRETGKAQDVIIPELRDEIVQGSSLSDALAKRPETFSSLYVNMVRAGEASGELSEVLERLCKHFERVQEAREKVMMALTYPLIMLAVGMVTILFTMMYVVPRFTAIFNELGSTLPLPTRMMIAISGFLVDYGLLVLAAVVAAFIGMRRYLATPAGTRMWHRAQLKIPLVRDIVTTNAYAHFARTLGALLANGVPVLDALTIVEDTVGNVLIADEIKNARNRVTDGTTISAPLAAGNIFPRLLTDMLAVGEETGDMSGALVHIARRYDSELDRNVKLFTTVLEPVMILAIAVVVGFVAVSMLLAVFDLTSGLSV
jgi:type IV pilus assembly protein PilC